MIVNCALVRCYSAPGAHLLAAHPPLTSPGPPTNMRSLAVPLALGLCAVSPSLPPPSPQVVAGQSKPEQGGKPEKPSKPEQGKPSKPEVTAVGGGDWEEEGKDKGCWWDVQGEKENKTCARDDVIGGRITPESCSKYMKQGWVWPHSRVTLPRFCTDGKYQKWMQKNCFTTCNGCCADLNNNCQRWAKEGSDSLF